jgi:hypothetical protein
MNTDFSIKPPLGRIKALPSLYKSAIPDLMFAL